MEAPLPVAYSSARSFPFPYRFLIHVRYSARFCRARSDPGVLGHLDRVRARRHPAHDPHGDAVPAPQPVASRRRFPSGARAFLPFLGVVLDRHDHEGICRDSSQAPRQVRDRRRSAQPADLRPQQGAVRRRRPLSRREPATRPTWTSTASARRTTGSSAISTRSHNVLGVSMFVAIDFLLFGAVGVAIWAIQMLWIPFWAAGVVNGLGHWWGYRNFETADTATNLTPWGVWLGGEELHNNHHAFPSSARFALRKFEFDIGWAMIRVLRDARPGQGAAHGADARPASERDTCRMRDTRQGRARASFPRDERLFPRRHRADAARRGRQRRRQHQGAAAQAAQGARQRRTLARRGLTRAPDMHSLRTVRSCAPSASSARALPRLTERNGRNGEALLDSLKQWCHEAEATGIRTLAEFATRLKGYKLRRRARLIDTLSTHKKARRWRAFLLVSPITARAPRIRRCVATKKTRHAGGFSSCIDPA